MENIREKLLERFLRYVSFDTQSDPTSETYPSTAKQLHLLNHLVEELTLLGLQEVEIDEHGYVTATIPATAPADGKPVIGLLSHVDTSPEMNGANIRPQVVENYDGSDISLGDSGLKLSVGEFPDMARNIGQTLITTDGTSLLGADDKAGVAEIVTAAEYLLAHPEIEHGKIRIGFTPDEEIGRGVDFFNVDHFGADYAYTMDGSYEGELEYENFNAASAKIVITGRNIHPGYAKDKMINALHIATNLDTSLPIGERPESTEGYEGFFHLVSLQGDVDHAEMEYIIRDHDRSIFERRKEVMSKLVETINSQFHEPVIELTLKDQYYNMREMVEPHPRVIELAKEAMQAVDVTPHVRPIRGGTDGSRLSYMGLPCPNLFTGSANFHGRFEYASLDVMEKATRMIIELARLWYSRS